MSLKIGVVVVGGKFISSALRILKNEGRKIHSEEIMKTVKTIFKKSQRLVPIEDGGLKASGRIQVVDRYGGKATIVIGYGDSANTSRRGAPTYLYARRQHDDPRLKRKKKPGRTWKYLSTPFNAHIGEIVPNTKKRFSDALKRRARR